jgi:hypothetical protein
LNGCRTLAQFLAKQKDAAPKVTTSDHSCYPMKTIHISLAVVHRVFLYRSTPTFKVNFDKFLTLEACS